MATDNEFLNSGGNGGLFEYLTMNPPQATEALTPQHLQQVFHALTGPPRDTLPAIERARRRWGECRVIDGA
jgi:hypothetical protein